MNFFEGSPDTDPQDLLDQLKRLCPMRKQEMKISAQTLRIWTACDMDPLLDALAAKPDTHPDVTDERMPYWAELWPSSLVLAETILHSKHTCPNGPWLELGCGPGLAGIAALKKGRPGVFTDYEEEALWLAALNALENESQDWSTRLLDWRNPPDDLQVPWILASDVAYEERLFQPLLNCFDQLLAPGGEIWFAEPGRSICAGLFQLVSEQGWIRSVVHRADPVKVYRFKRPTIG